MNTASLKLKYAGAAFVAVLLGTVLVMLLLGWQQRKDAQQLGDIAQGYARDRVALELQERANATARHAAESAAIAIRAGDTEALARRMQAFTDEPTLSSLTVRNPAGDVLYQWRRGNPPANALQLQSIEPVRAMVESIPGAATPKTLGELRVVVTQASSSAGGAGLLERMTSVSRDHFQTALLLASTLALLGGLVAAALAWRAGRKLEQPISALIRSADRIGQGDYTRPLDVARRDELGELQQALERMRGKLRQSTINKNYLTSVLNSMTDAVFVTSPDGVIRTANSAACKLLGYGEEELLGKNITAILDEREREDFDLLQAAQETRESVVRTRNAQTIPVSLTGSQIASDDPQFQGNIFVARNITDRKRAERRIRYLARYDALTKVPNRMQFHHLLQQAIARGLRGGQSVALLYLDMDRFKEVNDTFGHGSGDRVLEVLAERLTRALPKDTIIGRLAGDEFALFVDGLPAETDNRGPIAHLARSILTDVCRAFQLNQHEVFLTASIGIAFCPRDAENVIDLIRNADAAMYYSKQNGGNTFAFYSPEMNAAAVERLMLKSKLRRALERDEFVIAYQPKVDLRTGRIIGAEALLRWRLPGHGDIPPAQFIPLAEETNLILGIGEWVLNRVCADYRRWTEKIPNPGRISINLSLKQLRQASFITR
ncbi:MAG TPA: diguanylate cyclase, partial [Steroidobacteraceae bacterium]